MLVQKLSVTGNSIGHSGALLLLLQDAALLIIRPLLDGVPLRAAFISVLLIQIFGRLAFVVGFEEFRKAPDPSVSPSRVIGPEMHIRNISLELPLV